jgi:hypothetical protein
MGKLLESVPPVAVTETSCRESFHPAPPSVPLDTDLSTAVSQAAAEAGVSVSAWMGAAASDRLRNELLGAALDARGSGYGSVHR